MLQTDFRECPILIGTSVNRGKKKGRVIEPGPLMPERTSSSAGHDHVERQVRRGSRARGGEHLHISRKVISRVLDTGLTGKATCGSGDISTVCHTSVEYNLIVAGIQPCSKSSISAVAARDCAIRVDDSPPLTPDIS
jgi:hypothetical protein